MHPESREEELKKLALAFCTNPRRTAGELAAAAGKGTGKSVLPHGTGEWGKGRYEKLSSENHSLLLR